MSRSYRKPWIKDNANGLKQVCSRMHRRIAKQILKPWRNKYYKTAEKSCFGCECREWGLPCDFEQDPMEPTFPIRKELVDQYDICDWKMYRPNESYYYRK